MNIIQRAKNIIISPKKEWEVIKAETLSPIDMFTQYVVILAAIPAVAGFLGKAIFGIRILGMHYRLPIGSLLISTVFMYIFSIVGIWVLAFAMDALAPSFGSKKDMNASLKVAVFSYTPAWVFGILSLIPQLDIIAAIASLYSLFVLYWGMKSLKEPAQEKMTGYFIVTIVVAIVIYFVISTIVGVLTIGRMPTPGTML